MRLLNARTYRLEPFNNDREVPLYAILSHRWVEGEEVLYQDLPDRDYEALKGWAKIKKCCKQALEDGLEYVWIDTCCIDKESSAELSEAINSMFRWYRSADRCYAYLPDVAMNHGRAWKIFQFKESVWFKRAWTLQELLAPIELEFFDQDWEPLGSRSTLIDEISEASGIHKSVLDAMPFDFSRWSVAQRMSWASRRAATRIEDIAYSLLGIFDVNMPLLYGEGRKAFLRLQEEIIRRTHDHSIFAWSGPPDPDSAEHGVTGILATSPEAFQRDGDVFICEFDYPMAYSMTNLGLQISLRVKPWGPRLFLAALNCSRNSVDQIGIFILNQALGEAVAVRGIINGQMCSLWSKEQRESGIETITIATQIQITAIERLKSTMEKPCMDIMVDTSSLNKPAQHGMEQPVFHMPVERLASYKRTKKLYCFETARSECGSSGRMLYISSSLQHDTPRFGCVCILMYPLGTEHISAIKLGIDTQCNPVCIIADESNRETKIGAPGLSHVGARADCLPCRSRILSEKSFWQWNCLEEEGWLYPLVQYPGRPLLLRKRPPGLRQGLWALKGTRDKASFFRLPLGIDDSRDSIVVKLEIDRQSDEDYHWKFSIDWSPLMPEPAFATGNSGAEELLWEVQSTGVTGGPPSGDSESE